MMALKIKVANHLSIYLMLNDMNADDSDGQLFCARVLHYQISDF
jgi:hypothetical protein